MKSVIVLAIAMVGLSACGMTVNPPEHITVSGSPEGMRAFGDAMSGLIINGKASPDKKTAHTIMRTAQEKEITKREMTPSFLASIFARTSASNVTNLDVSESDANQPVLE